MYLLNKADRMTYHVSNLFLRCLVPATKLHWEIRTLDCELGITLESVLLELKSGIDKSSSGMAHFRFLFWLPWIILLWPIGGVIKSESSGKDCKAIGGKFDKEQLQEHRIYLNRKEYLAEKKKLYRKNKKALGQQQNIGASEPPQGIFIISNSNIIE